MAETLTGPFGVNLELLADLIAASESFQTWTETADATEARTKVIFSVALAADASLPTAMIGNNPGTAMRRNSSGGGDGFDNWVRGSMFLYFIEAVPAEYLDENSGAITDPANATKHLTEIADNILSDMRALSGDGTGHLSMAEIELADDTSLSDRADGVGTPEAEIFFRIGVGNS